MCWLHADKNADRVTEGFKADSLTFLLILANVSGCQIIIHITNVSLRWGMMAVRFQAGPRALLQQAGFRR